MGLVHPFLENEKQAVLREEVKLCSNDKGKQWSFLLKALWSFIPLETIEERSDVERWQAFKEFPAVEHDFSVLARNDIWQRIIQNGR